MMGLHTDCQARVREQGDSRVAVCRDDRMAKRRREREDRAHRAQRSASAAGENRLVRLDVGVDRRTWRWTGSIG
jgi:hypothetical protein